MNDKYAQEIEDFNRNFDTYRDKRIALYGIGRLTATLVENLKGFKIVGLLDKDPDNIGKSYFDLPVLSKDEAIENADIVIINTAGTYWNLIFERIKDWGLPVYYRNGEAAKEQKKYSSNDPYWQRSIEELRKNTEEADIVSFDFYGTLFQRKISNPKEVFELAERIYQFRYGESIAFSEARSRAVSCFPGVYTVKELYSKMREIEKWTETQAEQIYNIELELEKKLLIPRSPIIDMMKKVQEQGKELYVVSDMYLPETFFEDRLEEYGIEIEPSHIWVSSEKGVDKNSGKLWDLYEKEVINHRKTAIHIGDDQNADIDKATERGVETYYVADWMILLSKSSLEGLESRICSLSDSLTAGLIASKLLCDPFSLNKTHGQIYIKDPETMGYCVFGPVILSFFQWIDKQIRDDNTDRLIFMARDGYFLYEDYDYYQELLKNRNVESVYIGISRQLAMMSSIENDEDLWEFINMPYSGTIQELQEDRFGLSDIKAETKEGIESYLPKLRARVKQVRENYRKYVGSFKLKPGNTIIDLGYYGNNQRYLSKISGVNLGGYYLNGNVSEENPNSKIQKMKVCFQKTDDKKGEKSQILKYQIYLESFLTAPYGMITEVDEEGEFLCKPDGNNQRHFEDKRKINEGVKTFISDYLYITDKTELAINTEYADYLYGRCMNGAISFSDSVKCSFFNDNAMMNRQDSGLFI